MTQRRDLRIDAVRGVALVSMFLAHCSPSPGPGRLINLTEYATYPLFALLVGVGAELGARSGRDKWWVGPLVRGAALVVLAELLDGLYAQIYIVLAFLGVLTWLTAPLARAGSLVVGAAGLVALVVAPQLNQLEPTGKPDLFQFLVIGGPGYAGPYQVVSMVFYAAIGILVARHLLPADGDGLRVAVGLGCAAGAVALLGAHESGAFDMRAYDFTYRVLVFDGLLVAAIALLVVVVAGRWQRVAAPLAAMGSMSLTLYCLQIVWLDADLRVLGHASDDTWRNVAILVLGSLAFAMAWHAVIRVEPWRRGPLEAPVAYAVTKLSGSSSRD